MRILRNGSELLTIEQRITRLCVRLAVGVLSAYACFVVIAQSILAYEATSNQLKEISWILARNSAAAMAFGRAVDAAETLQTLQGNRWLSGVAIFDLQGRIFSQYRGDATSCLPLQPEPEGFVFTWCGARWSQAVLVHDRTIGHVAVVIGLQRFWEIMALSLVGTLMVMVVLLAIATNMARKMAGRMTAPLRDLANTAEQVAQHHDFRLRAIVGGAPEIRAVASGFNEMLEELAARDQRLRQMTHIDALTGLGNRRAYEEWLARSVREARVNGTRCALIYLDLDGFKSVNDGYGHAAGDAVLQTVAHRLRGSVRHSDFCCRLGGDEFAVVLDAQSTVTAAGQLAEKLCRALAMPYVHESHSLPRISSSIGIAVFPDDAQDAEELMSRADRAMYRAKAAGRNQVCHYGGQPSVMDGTVANHCPP